MRYSLWFKQTYADAILSGGKRDTIRAKDPGLRPGDLVWATVGPRPPFALLEIQAVEPVDLAILPADRAENLRRLYPGAERLIRITFDALPA